MELKVLGSGSDGNCYLLSSKTETLIIEVGLKYTDILKGLNFNISNVSGVLISHIHQDHFKAANDFSKNFIQIFGNDSVIEKLGDGTRMIDGKAYMVGNFKVVGLKVVHDTETFAFIINHQDMGTMLFCTDSAYLDYKVPGVNHMLIEANFSEELANEQAVNSNSFNNVERLKRSHMSLEETKKAIKLNNNDNLQNILLIHLSSRNSDETLFIEECQKISGVPVLVAKKGLKLCL